MPNLDKIMQLAQKNKETGTTQSNSSKQAQIVVDHGAGRVDIPVGTDTSKLTKETVQKIVAASPIQTVQQPLPTAQTSEVLPLSQRVKQSGGQASTPALPTGTGEAWQRQTLDTLMRGGQQQSALPYASQQKQSEPNIFERIGAIADASAKRGQGNFETLWESVGNWAGDKLMDIPVIGDWLEEQMQKPENAYLRESKTPLPYKTSKEIAYETAERDIERAKEGLGKGGQAAVDLASTISDMGFNIAASAVTGLPARGFNTASSAASAIEQAKADGSTDDEALAYGALRGGLSYAFDKLSGGIPGFGKGFADDMIAKVSSKIAKSPAGANLVKRAFDVLGEGAEEVLETAVDPLLQRLTYDENADFATGEDLLYSAVMGALASAVFNAPGAVADTVGTVKSALPRKTSSVTAEGGATFPKGEGLDGESMVEVTTPAAEGGTPSGGEDLGNGETEAGFFGAEVDAESDPSAEAKAHMAEMDAPPKQEALHDKDWYEATYQAREAGKRLGVNVVVTKDLPSGVNGRYENGTIYISENAKNPLKQTFVHELTHHLEATNTYGELSEYVLERAANGLTKDGKSIDDYRRQIKDAYAANGKTIDDAAADQEIVANYIEQKLFNDSKEIAHLANKHRNLVQVIRDWFEDLRVKFRGTAEEKELLRAQRLFEKALRETNVKGYRTSGDGQYAVNPNFQNAYRAWTTQYPNSNITFSVGTTSKALQEIGVNERTIKWDSKKIRETKQKHPEITDAVIEQVPNLLENPIIVMHSKNPQYQSRITMFGEVYGDNGLPVMAVVELMPTDRAGNYSLDEIKVASTHTRMDRKNPSAMTQTQNMINSSEILYVEPDKNKTNRWLSTTGLQLPFAANYGLNKTLAQIGVNVNGQNSIEIEGDLLRASSGRTAEEVKADTKAAVEQYSAMEPHRQPGVREATYPYETAQGKTMRTPQNIGGSNLVDDRIELDIEEAILDGKFAYEVKGDKASMREANERIENGDYKNLAEQAKGLFADGYRLKKEQVVFVERMIQEASKKGDVDTAMSLIADLAAYGTEQGQNIQALSLIRRMTPEGKLMVLKRQVDKANKITQVDRESKGEIKKVEREIKAIKREAFEGLEDIGVDESMDIETAQRTVEEAIADETKKSERTGLPTAKKQKLQQKKQALSDAQKRINELEKAAKKLKNPVTIPKETVEAMLKAKAPSEQNDLYNKALDEIASQIVSSKGDKINAWRYLAMLGNPRTHARNFTGNATMYVTNAAKNIVKRGIELIPGTQKTTVLKASKDAKEFAKEDFELNRDLITGGGKQNASDELRDRMTIFKNKGLEALRKFNTNAMEKEDTLFMRHAYESALARYITANKKSKAFLESGSTAAESFLQKARAYAIKEAREVTFHDDSAVADWLSGITRSAKRDKVGVKAAKALVEGVLPFKKTPINVAKRGIEYSPVSLGKAAYKGVKKLFGGDAAGAIDDLAKGTTGTIMMGIGLALAHLGMLRTKNEEKDEVLDTQENEQNYSLRIPNEDGTVTSVSLDALMPAAMPLLVGVEVNKLLKEEGRSVMSVLESLTGIADPIVENSMLDGLNDMLSYIGYSDNALGAILTDMGESYVEQFRPSVLRQLAQTIDPTVRTTYSPKDSPIWKTPETHLRSLANALPWGAEASEKIDEAAGTDRFALQPKIDVWGNEVKRADSFGARLVQNMVLPFNVKKVTSDPVNEELRRLYHVDSTYSVLPKAADKSFELKNERYYPTPSEYTALAKEKGQTSKEFLDKTIKDAGYKDLPDGKKADVVSNLLMYANYKAKQDFFDGRGISYVTDTFNGVEKAVDRGLTAEEYYIMKAQMDGGVSAAEKIPYYMDMLTSEQKSFVSRLPKDAASAAWLERIALSNQGEDAKTTSAYDDLLIGEKKEKIDYSDKASIYLSLIDGNANSKVGDKYYEYAKPAGVSVEDYMVAYFAQKDVTYPAKTKGAKAAAEAAAIDKELPNLSKKQREALYQAFKG